MSRPGLRPSRHSQVRKIDPLPVGYETILNLNVEVITRHRSSSLQSCTRLRALRLSALTQVTRGGHWRGILKTSAVSPLHGNLPLGLAVSHPLAAIPSGRDDDIAAAALGLIKRRIGAPEQRSGIDAGRRGAPDADGHIDGAAESARSGR